MRRTFSIFAVTLSFLVLIDVAVAIFLNWVEREGHLTSLVKYFDYGRSVPGKLYEWEQNPGQPGNLYEVAWLAAGVKQSTKSFAERQEQQGPVVRAYGMSFVGNILREAKAIDPTLELDLHAGPGAPPNFTYAYFLDDRSNRAASDITVLGILSSSVPAMSALSNQTWVFEQPAPFTYPIFRPGEGGTVQRIDPIVKSVEQHRSLNSDTDLASAWIAQLTDADAYYSSVTYGATWLDRSPFARLVRRAMATRHIQRINSRIVDARDYPFDVVLRHMTEEFADLARADGQLPVVMLIQSRDPRDPDLLKLLGPTLNKNAIPFVATAEHADPRDPGNFLGDGHYKASVDRIFGQAFIELIRSTNFPKP